MSVLRQAHVGISVSDMASSLGFYGEGLGLDVLSDQVVSHRYLHEILRVPFDEIRIARLRLPAGGHLELLEYRPGRRQRRDVDPSQPGSGHIAVEVESVLAVHARLVGADHRVLTPHPVTIDTGVNVGCLAAYVIDPDGFFVEVIQRPR